MDIQTSPQVNSTASTTTSSVLTTNYDNTKQNKITIFEDTIRVILMKYQDILLKQSAWYAPLGIFITIAVIFPTATFHDILIIKAEYIRDFFICVLLISLYLLIRAVIDSIKNCGKIKGPIIELIINEMRGKEKLT